MASREEILADFQACTGIEDVEVAICQLEEAGWNLLDAVNKAMPTSPDRPAVPPAVPAFPAQAAAAEANNRAPSPPIRVDSISGMDIPPAPFPPGPFNLPGISSGISVSDDFFGGPSSSRTRMLEFTVQHGADRIIHLEVPDKEDIKTLKQLIQKETGVPPCQQDLRGFKGTSGLPPSDRRRLSELNLPKENVLYLLTDNIPPELRNGDGETKESEPLGDFKLHIKDDTHKKDYTINFRPHQSVLQVKLDVAALTTIAVSKQQWTGWPDEISDELSLAQIGIPQEYTLHLQSLKPDRSMPTVENSSNSGSEDEYEDAMEMEGEDYFVPEASSSKRIQPLLPDDYGDETMAGIKFAEEFANRYGSPHPMFFQGKLEDAIKESCMQPAKDRKMLLIYFHHDTSVLTNVFCTQVLCAESLVAFLNANFVCFGWDLTYQSNRNRAADMISREFGSIAAATIKNIEIERLPICALVYRLRGTTELVQTIHGNVSLDEMMSQLLSAQETYNSQLAVEVREEEERAARDFIKKEQDLAFLAAQAADREKEAQRQREEEERQEQEKLEAAIRQSEEEARQAEEKVKERQRQELKRKLPSEPGEADDVAQVRFRCPAGRDNIERRFRANETLQVLLDFLTVEGFSPEEYKVLSSWPRKDLTQNPADRMKTLRDLKIFPQETLTLEEK